jgi:outer membrane protein assembly factor BamE (lipoprotein component of BamABCDE complex)/ketosteroid isomerase-like protein
MKMRRSIILLAVLASACTSTIPSLKPYKMDIQQGNIVNAKMMSQLRPGMSKSQVKFILGTPLIQDSFHKNRWDYFYEMRKGSGEIEQRRVILDFEDDKLKGVRGDAVVNGDNIELTQPDPTVLTKTPSTNEEKSGWLDKLEFWKKQPSPATSSTPAATTAAVASTSVATAASAEPAATLATIADTAPATPPQLEANTPVNNAEVISAPEASVEAAKVEAMPEAVKAEAVAPAEVASATATEPAKIAASSETATEPVVLAGESGLKSEAVSPAASAPVAAAEEPLAQVERMEQVTEKTVAAPVAPVAEAAAPVVVAEPVAAAAAAEVAAPAVAPASVEAPAAAPVVLARMSDEIAESEKAAAKAAETATPAPSLIAEDNSNTAKATAPTPEEKPQATVETPVVQTPAAKAVAPVVEAPKVEATPAPVVASKPAAPAVIPAPAPTPAPAVAEQDVLAQLNAWSDAWRNKQVKQYLSFYAPDFKPEGLSKNAWLVQRKQRIAKPSNIDLSIEDIQTHIDGNTAQTEFVQRYSNGTFSDVVHKTLAWKSTKQGLQITQEVAHTISTATATPAAASVKATSVAPATAADPAINAVIQAWADAWRSKNVESYLGYYADNFVPEGLPSKQAWIAQRKQRLNKPGAIEVELQNLNISTQEQSASASFVQIYKSQGYSDKVNKTLQFERVGNDWRIVKETSSAASKVARKAVKEVMTLRESTVTEASKAATPAPSAPESTAPVASPAPAEPVVEKTPEPSPAPSEAAKTESTDKIETTSKSDTKPGFLERMLEKIGF